MQYCIIYTHGHPGLFMGTTIPKFQKGVPQEKNVTGIKPPFSEANQDLNGSL